MLLETPVKATEVTLEDSGGAAVSEATVPCGWSSTISTATAATTSLQPWTRKEGEPERIVRDPKVTILAGTATAEAAEVPATTTTTVVAATATPASGLAVSTPTKEEKKKPASQIDRRKAQHSAF